MAISVKCPSCAYKGQVPDQFQGRKVKCPGCTKFFTVGANGTGGPKPPEKKPAAKGPANALEFDSKETTLAGKMGAKAKPRVKQPPRSKVPLFMGLVALVAGLGSAALCAFLPDVVMIALIVGVVGILFALMGLIWNLLQRKFGALPLLSLLSSVGAVVLAVLVQSGVVPQSFAMAGPKPQEQAKVEEKAKPTPKEVKKLDPALEELLREPVGSIKGASDASKPIRTASASVLVADVRIGPVSGKDLDGQKAQKPYLVVYLQIKNAGDDPLDYRGGGSPDLSKTDYAPVLIDNEGNVLKMASFGAKAQLDGQLKSEKIATGTTANDILVFDKPSDRIEFLRLMMSGANFGSLARIKVHIPVAMISVKGPTTATTTPTPMPMPTNPTTPTPPPAGMLDAAKKKELEAALKETNNNLRRAALEEIEKLGPKAAEMAPEVLKHLEDKDDLCRAAAAEALGQMGPAVVVQALLPLYKSLDDEFQEVRKQAAIALGKMGPEAKLAVAPLQKLARETKDKEVLDAAQKAIRLIDPKAPLK